MVNVFIANLIKFYGIELSENASVSIIQTWSKGERMSKRCEICGLYFDERFIDIHKSLSHNIQEKPDELSEM